MEFEDRTEDIPKEILSEDCRVGDVTPLSIVHFSLCVRCVVRGMLGWLSTIKITVDKAATVKRKEEIDDLMNELFED